LFSVIICTHNRVGDLRTALESVFSQDLDDRQYEVIVVDGSSTDGTGDFVRARMDERPDLRYVNEEKPGLSHARNRGRQLAAGRYCVYIDDDCKAPQDWLSRAAGIVERLAPDAFGGPFFPFYSGDRPAWWQDAYGSRNPLAEARMLSGREYLYGGNFFIRTSVLEAVGGFSPLFGPAGSKLGVGDETELLNRMRAGAAPPSIYFDPELFVFHLVRSEKMSVRWAFYFNFTAGKYYRAYREAVPEKSPGRVLRLAFTIVREIGIVAVLALAAIWRDRTRFPQWQNYFYEIVAPRAYRIGRSLEQLRE
jgi:glycosyltransferase involved in cell wall biosynthesis